MLRSRARWRGLIHPGRGRRADLGDGQALAGRAGLGQRLAIRIDDTAHAHIAGGDLDAELVRADEGHAELASPGGDHVLRLGVAEAAGLAVGVDPTGGQGDQVDALRGQRAEDLRAAGLGADDRADAAELRFDRLDALARGEPLVVDVPEEPFASPAQLAAAGIQDDRRVMQVVPALFDESADHVQARLGRPPGEPGQELIALEVVAGPVGGLGAEDIGRVRAFRQHQQVHAGRRGPIDAPFDGRQRGVGLVEQPGLQLGGGDSDTAGLAQGHATMLEPPAELCNASNASL